MVLAKEFMVADQVEIGVETTAHHVAQVSICTHKVVEPHLKAARGDMVGLTLGLLLLFRLHKRKRKVPARSGFLDERVSVTKNLVGEKVIIVGLRTIDHDGDDGVGLGDENALGLAHLGEGIGTLNGESCSGEKSGGEEEN